MEVHEIEALIREERRRYAKEWRARNKDRVRESNRRYWEKKALMRTKAENNEKMEVSD